MTRKWGPTGVASYRSFRISPETEEQLRRQLPLSETTSEPEKAFFAALSNAIGLYLANRSLAEQTLPGAVGENLKAAITAALELNKQLNNLDGNSRILLQRVPEGDIEHLQRDLLGGIIRAVAKAKDLANQYPKGRPRDYARLWLAVDVADALQTHLGIHPTSTKDGQFEATLAITLQAATGEESTSTHDLARRALASRKLKGPAGEIEYRFPEDE